MIGPEKDRCQILVGSVEYQTAQALDLVGPVASTTLRKLEVSAVVDADLNQRKGMARYEILVIGTGKDHLHLRCPLDQRLEASTALLAAMAH